MPSDRLATGMSLTSHRVYLGALASIVLILLILLTYNGYSYYTAGIEERFDHTDHESLRSSGITGHGLGIFGTLSIIIGVVTYMARKRYRYLSRAGILKYWLEFHIFLCTLGPVLILFHTAFRIGGLVAVSFWCMTAVFLSGIVGRFIYLQIPRSIEGRELSLNEARQVKGNLTTNIRDLYNLDENSYRIILDSTGSRAGLRYSNPVSGFFKNLSLDQRLFRSVKEMLRKKIMPKSEKRSLLMLVRQEISLNRKIETLVTMQSMFRFWHVIHLPFAIVMLIIMLIHVGVTILLGYRWIF